MAVGINSVGELSYNGINFDGASRITVATEPVRDEANQTTSYRRYTITVAAVIQNNDGTDGNLYHIRNMLSEDGKRLVFKQKGFGNDLLVSPSGPVRDIRMGPKPQVLEWRPIGASRACEIIWQVEACITECESAGRARQAGPIAFNYELDFDIDEHGDTTRTASGYLEICQTRLPNRTLSDTADRWREALTGKVPNGFKRSQRFHLSKDKSRLDFTITDTQIPSSNPYPANVTSIDGTHTVSVSLTNGGFLHRRNVISLEVTLKRGLSGTQAWLIFFKILNQRLLGARQAGAQVILEDLTVDEDLFGRRCSFAVGYRVIGTIHDLLRDTGLYQPLPSEFRWRDWHQSIEKEQSVRGNRGLFHNPATDLIIDPCGPIPTATVHVEQEPGRPRSTLQPTLRNPLPPPEKSYMRYENYMMPSSDSANVRHSVLQPPSQSQSSYPYDQVKQDDVVQTIPNGGPIISPSAPYNAGKPAGTSDIIQQRGARMHSLRMIGYAVRAGHQIPKPRWVGTQLLGAQESNAQFSTTVAGVYWGLPIYKAWWILDYDIPNTPGDVLPPLTPHDV